MFRMQFSRVLSSIDSNLTQHMRIQNTSASKVRGRRHRWPKVAGQASPLPPLFPDLWARRSCCSAEAVVRAALWWCRCPLPARRGGLTWPISWATAFFSARLGPQRPSRRAAAADVQLYGPGPPVCFSRPIFTSAVAAVRCSRLRGGGGGHCGSDGGGAQFRTGLKLQLVT